MHITSKDQFETQLAEAGGKLVVVDFFATWCGPCRMITPRLEELANEMADTLVVLKVDVDELEELAMKYDIKSLPTFVFFKNGNKIDEFTGANFDKLKSFVDKLK
ncbi:thioredoxin 2 [Arctopsyche grandis]|uniref:thioredoxin 2 n=1 Tax=Arctopsyche grandis TaxID=121162 RepID=UPI00406D88F4